MFKILLIILSLLYPAENINLNANANDNINFKNFVPLDPVLSAREIKPGDAGYMLTVLKGTEPEKIPVEIISVISQKPNKNISDVILIKMLNHELARGMSGSPVYIKNKLIGAVSSGWDFGDHKLAMVTPIEDMCKIFDDETRIISGKNLISLNSLTLSGIKLNKKLEKFAENLGTEIINGVKNSNESNNLNLNPNPNKNKKFKPGDSMAALIVWGDVEIAGAGTVTAISSDDKFIAFGHSILNRGKINFPCSSAYVHETVKNISFPFKLASSGNINGTILQDRKAGIGGVMNKFPEYVPVEFNFYNADNETRENYKFNVASDEFLIQSSLEGILTGLTEEAWKRKGNGTISVILRIENENIKNGWTRKEIFYSDDNVIDNAFKQSLQIIGAYLTQPFKKSLPAKFIFNVEATERPKALIIESVKTVNEASPGEDIIITIKLRAWRNKPFEKKFKMHIPEDAGGVCEVIVRGGSFHPLSQLAVEQGLKSIDGLDRMLNEIKALDANNELIIELNADNINNALKNAKSGNENENENITPDFEMLPEENEYLSETKLRRIREGNLKIFGTEYFIDGEMKFPITIRNE